jgi:tRNA A-37 threonylcarbamoyl transferase component Bud32
MFPAAGCFLGLFALYVYTELWGPGSAGVSFEFHEGRMISRAVRAGDPAERAGLAPGDWVVAAGGQPIHNIFDWTAIEANIQIARPLQLEIERGGQRREVTLAFDQAAWKRWTTDEWVSFLARRGAELIMLGLALLVAFSRRQDLVARVGAWFLGSYSVSSMSPLCGWAVTWRSLPAMLGAPLWIAYASFTNAPALLFTFFALFPRSFFRTRSWMWIWLLSLFFPPMLLYLSYRTVYDPEHTSGVLPDWFVPLAGLTVAAFLVASAAMLVMNYLRLEDLNERRRLRVVVIGAVVGLLGGTLPFLTRFFESTAGMSGFLVSPGSLVVSNVLGLAFPVSLAYGILRHRLFDIRVMIRQGVQYAAARRMLLALVPVSVGILLLDLLLHGDQPLLTILRARGWVYVVLGGLAVAAHVQRRQWQDALDRRFFRERYDAQHLLREVVEEIREAASFARMAPRVVARIETALHPEFAALLVRGPAGREFHILAAAPAGQTPPPLSTGSKLIGLLRLLGKPLEVSLTESGWLKQQLPHEETDFLRQARIDLLVPIAMSPERAEALLALGAKRSEEPYSREDLDLLVAIATSLALLLEKPAGAPERTSEKFEECPQCGVCYDTGAARCAQDHAALNSIRAPRSLAGRYRLDRRLGQGGMGAVYEATDTALERRVAVKLIREDLVGSAEAAERFRREARIAASFTHPNVVTVYDFGVAADMRAFLVMELLKGTPLRDELRKAGRMPAPRALAILRSVCAAVEAAHSRQLVHRDLKPENIFLICGETAEQAKVLDFGIAKFLPSETQVTADTATGVLAGTLRYMAPEQLRGGVVDAAWDLWALAVVAYEMLAGAYPFPSATPAELHSAVLAGRFTPVNVHLSTAPAAWQEFFASALATYPGRRPDSARTLLSELERALA